MSNKPDDATVRDIRLMMDQLERDGFGHYVVTCNDEYTLAKKNDSPDVKHDKEVVDMGGYEGYVL